jgi:hypothetical protein
MTASAVTVKVSGLRELRGALKSMDKNMDKELGKALFVIARGIAAKISGAMPHLSGHAAGTVTPHAKIRGASISIGTGDAGDYVPWLDFGGRVGRQGSVRRPYIKTGRYLYPQIEAARPATLAAIDEAIGKAAQQAGFTTTGKSA